MKLIGVSGLADKLQEDVKHCVSDFIEAGIKVWIVTGDKDSTAKSIGYQTGILNEGREMLKLSPSDEKTINKDALINNICLQTGDQDLMISGTAIAVLF